MSDYYPNNGKARSDKKAIIIIGVITLILFIVWGALLAVFHSHKTWIFKPYSRPPLPDQKGDAGVLKNNSYDIKTSPGSVTNLGNPRERTPSEEAFVQKQYINETSAWEKIRTTEDSEAQKTSLTLIEPVGLIHPDTLSLFASR